MRRAIAQASLDVEPEFVDDGLKAIRYLESHEQRHAPALLLLDLKMPLMDGFEVLEWLQQHPAARPDHVVVLSSCCGQNELTRSMRLGVDHYVVKPGDPTEFAATVKRLGDYCTTTGNSPNALEESAPAPELVAA